MEDEQFETEDWHDTEEIGSQLEQVNLAHPAARRAVPVPYARIVVYGLRQGHNSLKYPPHLKRKGEKKKASLLFPRTTPLVAAVC